jgi:hypothetical protein
MPEDRQRELGLSSGLSKSLLHVPWLSLAGLIMLAAVLQVGAGAGMAYVADFDATYRALGSFQWPWLLALTAGLFVALVGSYYATSGIYKVECGPSLRTGQLRSVVLASFGGFLAHGGAGLDKYAIKAAGGDDHSSQVRVAAFAGLEHGVLSLLGTAAGIALLVEGLSAPPLDFSVPWAVIPVPGFLLAFWLAGRFQDRYRDADGWRRKVGVFLESIVLVRQLFTRDIRRHPAVAGMALFWCGEMFAIWCGLAAFGFQMNIAQLVIGAGTGMLFTRRTGPLAGAGILVVTLSVTIWYSGAPFPVAVAGVFIYRVLALWLPTASGLTQIKTLRAIGSREEPGAEGRAAESTEPALPSPAAR